MKSRQKNINVKVDWDQLDTFFAGQYEADYGKYFFINDALSQDEKCDFYQNIRRFDGSAMKWGEDLFSYYEKMSRRVRFKATP